MSTTNNYQQLISKLDRFTRKYYINQLIRGSLYSIGLILGLFLLMNLLEHQFYFGTTGRKFLFYSFVGISVVALAIWVINPLLHYFRLGKLISHERAAEIIGEHFSNVKDKLLNILQLKKQADHASDASLLLASINQKTEEIKPVPFPNAINLAQNKKYLRYALPPLLLLLIILFAAPSMIKESTKRLIQNDKEFEKEAPFSFLVEEEDLRVVQFEDFLLSVNIEGAVQPNEVFINIDNYQYRLNKETDGSFSYRFSNVQKDTDFFVFSSGVESKPYHLHVLKKPNILGFEIKLDYPAYTQRKDESISNIGDLVVPVGTQLDWVFNASNTDLIQVQFSTQPEIKNTNRFSDELFTFKKKALRDETYQIFISNEDLPKADSITYAITVIPDLHPSIQVEKFEDSTDQTLLFFVGDASDDYGLRSLSFHYQIKKAKGEQGALNSIKMQQPTSKQIQYDYTWDISSLELEPGDEVTYYFEVFDNDAVHGSKSARTQVMTFAKPSVDEYEEMAEQNTEDIKKNLEESLKESKKIKEDMKKLREKMLQEKEMDWQTRKELEKLLERQKELERQINEAKQKFEENIKNQNEFEKPNEELLEKQEKVQELFEEVMSEEMKELMKQIEELLQELDKDEALEMMEDMEMSDEEMEMELDRMLELLKQLEVEAEMEKAIEKLEQLAEEQEQLAEETEQDEKSAEQLEKEQKQINEKFDDIQKELDELKKKNEELENPKDLGDQKEQMEDIEQDLQESQEQLQQKQKQKASKAQKQAAQKMKQMANAMQQQMASQQMEQMEEDMEALRQLLENLIALSFDQEDLIKLFNTANINTPHYVGLVQDQYKLKDDFKLIEDSLHALSKRVYQIESFVTEKVTEIKVNMKESIDELEERHKVQAADNQQRTMKNVNDLALMLSEVMNQMQQQMSSMMQGNQMCNKPGGKGGKSGKVPIDKISKGQKQLNKDLQQMKDALQKGKQGSSKQFAQMAARQAALQKALRNLQKKKQERGEGTKELQQIIDQMNKMETDLVNKTLTNEMLKRQEEILTRLLKAEKAEREREYDEKRKAETATQKERKMPPSLQDYIKKREAEVEMFKAVSPALKPYYKFLVEEYFKSLKNSKTK